MADYLRGFGMGWVARLRGLDLDLSNDERDAVVEALNREIDAAIEARIEMMEKSRH
jgi:hypothetical protein